MDKHGNEVPQSTLSVCKDVFFDLDRGLHKEKRSICESYAYAPVPKNEIVSIMSSDGKQTPYEKTDSKGCVTFKNITTSNGPLSFMIYTDGKWHNIPFKKRDLGLSSRNMGVHKIRID